MTPSIASKATWLLIGLFHEAYCATSYSNVFVRGGSEVVPIEYINYGGPFAFNEPQIAQISAAPLETVVSLPNARPCVSPCVIANSPISGLAPFAATANAQIVAYNPPVANVPIVLANTDDATGYQYAYAVYDEGTGDKKTQSEQSDGSKVQGQYSFIQPDGYRREVVYTADDSKGFNAVVKTVAPEPTKSEEAKEMNESPCNQLKKEQLVEAPQPEKSTESAEQTTEGASDTDAPMTETADTQSDVSTSEETPSPTTEATKPDLDNAIFSYNDIINCLQAKRIANSKSISPLTYVLIPSFRSVQKPC